jgi:hypothetical protein
MRLGARHVSELNVIRARNCLLLVTQRSHSPGFHTTIHSAHDPEDAMVAEAINLRHQHPAELLAQVFETGHCSASSFN